MTGWLLLVAAVGTTVMAWLVFSEPWTPRRAVVAMGFGIFAVLAALGAVVAVSVGAP